MAEGTYEYECMRAELLGLDKPDEAEFDRMRLEQEQQQEAEAVLLETQEEMLQGAGGKLDELNSILNSTQQKLNRFKQTACSSLVNIFSRSSVDISESDIDPSGSGNSSHNVISSSAEQSGEATGGFDNNVNSNDKHPAEQQEIIPIIPTEKIRASKIDKQQKMATHLGKLDVLINKAENAEISMSKQTQQMRKMAQ